MITRENTIGVVHWGGMWAGTTGEQIALVIPAFFQGNHAPFLKDIIASRLDEMFGYDGLTIVLEPGELSKNNRGTRYEPGTVAIYGINEPWPDPADFREALDGAFIEAGEVEAAQMKKADALGAHLPTGLTFGDEQRMAVQYSIGPFPAQLRLDGGPYHDSHITTTIVAFGWDEEDPTLVTGYWLYDSEPGRTPDLRFVQADWIL
jgi:hypothetical protein